MNQLAGLLKSHGLSSQQYNVLRILRGAGEEGISCGEISQRMTTHDPDVTRLVDRLQKCGFAERLRKHGDRRMVHVRITVAAQALLEDLDVPVTALHREQFGILSVEEIIQLVALLERLR